MMLLANITSGLPVRIFPFRLPVPLGIALPFRMQNAVLRVSMLWSSHCTGGMRLNPAVLQRPIFFWKSPLFCTSTYTRLAATALPSQVRLVGSMTALSQLGRPRSP